MNTWKMILTLGLFAAFGFLALGSGSESEKPGQRQQAAPLAAPSTAREQPTAPTPAPPAAAEAEGNAIVRKCVDEGASTYEKNQCQAAYKGKALEFVGDIKDIKNAKTLHVMLDTGNYADVSFKKKVADQVSVGDTLRFTGKVTFWGSGILFSHEIKATEFRVEE